jgi:hypothetical protein
MRLHEFRTDEEQLDEILPLIPAIAGGVARAAIGGVGRLAGKAAMGVGKAAVKGAGKLAKGAVKGVAKGVANTAKAAANAVTGDDDEQQAPASPNATVGTQPATQKPTPMGAAEPTKGAAPVAAKTVPVAGTSAEIRTGATVDLPTKSPGGTKAFKVTKAQGDNIEIEDPQAKPGEPAKMVYKKQDLERAMGNETK